MPAPMTARMPSVLLLVTDRLRAAAPSLAALLAAVVLAACGGSADAPPPPGGAVPPPVAGVPPTITQEPANATVVAGQPATFTVAATGDPTIVWQWQRDGAPIAGATATTYTLGVAALGDSGATFRAVATNGAGSATSTAATLSVTAAVPVLTVAPQPANASVVAGTAASFTVGGTCSAGTLTIQWQRLAGAAFADVAGATAATLTLATSIADNGAQVRAALACSGLAATTSNVATLTVTAQGGVTLALHPLVGLREQARVSGATVIDRLADGSHAVAVGSRLRRLAADRLSLVPIAGTAQDGYADGPAATAQFRNPMGIAHDATGVLYVADTQNHAIRRIATDGTVSTLAGGPGTAGNADGTGSAARFASPSGIVLGPDGDLYVADRDNATVRRVTTAGVVTTYAGSVAGFLDGPAGTARFNQPFGLAVAADGDLYVTDRANQRVRRVVRAGNAAGTVETFAGSGAFAIPGDDGPGATAGLPFPGAIVLQGGALYVRDIGGLVRRIDVATRAVSTFAGSRALGDGFADGPPGAARLRGAALGLAPAAAGGFVAADDLGLRAIDAAGAVATLAAASGNETDAGTGVLVQLPLQAGTVAVDSGGRAVNVDTGSRAVRRIDATGAVSLVAGLTGSVSAVVDGTGSAAQFADPGLSIAAGAGNVLYVGDSYALRRIASDGTVATVAGSTTVFGGVDGSGAAARFNRLFGLAVAPGGDVLVADAGNNAIRRVTPAGVVTTVAGVFGQSARVDGPVATARLQRPSSVTVTPDGAVWFADGLPGSQVLRRLSADGASVSTPAGTSGAGIVALASDAAGIVYYMVNADLVLSGGLHAYDPATATSTRLVTASVSQQTVLGSVAPSLPPVQSIAVLGPKRLLVSGATQLFVVTLP